MTTSTALDNRRDQSAAAGAAAEKAKAEVEELDHRLQTNATLTLQQEQALRNALAEADRLKRSLKNAAKEKDRLARDHKRAVARAVKAEAKAAKAEARYDKSVLAEMVKREKERDRASASTPAAQNPASPPGGESQQGKDNQQSKENQQGGENQAPETRADPAPEAPDPATVTAVRTAARKTAASAGVRTPRTRRTG